MTKSERKYIKRVIGSYNQCINSMSVNPNTEHIRLRLNKKILELRRSIGDEKYN